jgi:hypothetical protein
MASSHRAALIVALEEWQCGTVLAAECPLRSLDPIAVIIVITATIAAAAQ